ncbi:hypothetical protein Tco_1172022, partial [Tanacetum coccineum]
GCASVEDRIDVEVSVIKDYKNDVAGWTRGFKYKRIQMVYAQREPSQVGEKEFSCCWHIQTKEITIDDIKERVITAQVSLSEVQVLVTSWPSVMCQLRPRVECKERETSRLVDRELNKEARPQDFPRDNATDADITKCNYVCLSS